MAKVRIVKVPKAEVGVQTFNPGLYGTNGNKQFSFNKHLESGKMSEAPIEARKTLGPVDREDANLEAEKGETAVINVQGIPAHFNIGGKRHSQGGTPLNLPDNSFIFSDTSKMKIKDPLVLAQFGMAPKKGGYTPAEISKKYDINKYRKTLADPDTEDMDRKTAEMMISNYNLKLAKLALAQESIKGFPQGIPVIAMPYIESMEIDPSTFLPDQAQGQLEQGSEPDAEMGTVKYGGLPKAQSGIDWSKDSDVGPYYRKYTEALNSKDPKVMQAAAGMLDEADIEGLGWIPGSKQNKLVDLSQILNKQAKAYDKKPVVKVTTDEELDTRARQQASEAFTKAFQLKEQAKLAGDPDKEIMYDDMLKELHKVHPDYKAVQDSKSAWGSRLYRKPEYVNDQLKTPALYYNNKEKELIADYHAKLSPAKETAKAVTKPVINTDVKKSVESKINWTSPSQESINQLSDEEYAYLMRLYDKHPNMKKALFEADGGAIYQEGGEALEEFQSGGRVKVKGAPGVTTSLHTSKRPTSQPGIKLTPEEEETRRKNAETTPEKYVSDTDYDELAALYTAAQKSSQGNPNKKTPETLAFQKRYHELLPDEARRIISSEKDPTNKGKTLGHGEKYDLTANEDSMFGKRTEQYWQAVKKAPPAIKKELLPIVEKPIVPGVRPEIKRNPPLGVNPKSYAPWWLQDIVKTSGAAADLMRIKKYEPWQQTPETRLPDGTFYDPTRELAANTEIANIGTQGATAFNNPQAYAANFSQIQGQAGKNAADIMAKYNNMNVQIANQLNSERTGIMNDASKNKASLDTQLFDKYTIANQQFDNSKNMARQNLRQSYIDAITNRAKTQALNTLYPNYYTNPITGGFVQFKPGYDKITPNAPHDEADLAEVEKIVKRFPGTTFTEALKHVKGKKGAPEDDNTIDAGYLRSQGYSGQ